MLTFIHFVAIYFNLLLPLIMVLLPNFNHTSVRFLPLVPYGIRTKWPSWRRTPLYHFFFSPTYGFGTSYCNGCSIRSIYHWGNSLCSLLSILGLATSNTNQWFSPFKCSIWRIINLEPYFMPLICHNMCHLMNRILPSWTVYSNVQYPSRSGEPCLVWISLVLVSESLLLAFNAQFIHVQNSINFNQSK